MWILDLSVSKLRFYEKLMKNILKPVCQMRRDAAPLFPPFLFVSLFPILWRVETFLIFSLNSFSSLYWTFIERLDRKWNWICFQFAQSLWKICHFVPIHFTIFSICFKLFTLNGPFSIQFFFARAKFSNCGTFLEINFHF